MEWKWNLIYEFIKLSYNNNKNFIYFRTVGHSAVHIYKGSSRIYSTIIVNYLL